MRLRMPEPLREGFSGEAPKIAEKKTTAIDENYLLVLAILLLSIIPQECIRMGG